MALTQDELADKTGLSVRTIRALESGRVRTPRQASVRRLADVFGLQGAEREQFYLAASGKAGGGEVGGAAADGGGASDVGPSGGEPSSGRLGGLDRLGLLAGRGVVTPAQLPADVLAFTGRRAELDLLDGLLAADAGADRTAPPVAVAAISGAAGVGKTALAIHWAHRVRGRFPDGQLYLNLRGYDPSGRPTEPAAALRGLLDALGVPAQRVPPTFDAQIGLYRSLLADRRILVVLDNARDAEHARPLLPGAPGCAVVVTSRGQLTPLVATNGARPIALDTLSTVEARELLARRLGADRVAAEPEAVEEIIAACARLPLALTITAARGATHPRFPLGTLAAALGEADRRLDALGAGDQATEVRVAFSWSYRRLSRTAARLFRLLSLHPGPDVTAAAAASLAATPVATAERLLAEVARASLLAEHAPGRYAYHDLLRVYATELADAVEPAAERRAAAGRLLDHCLHGAYAADRLLDPARDPLTLDPPAPGVVPVYLADDRQAATWLTVERPTLVALLRLAAEEPYDVTAWRLAWTLDTILLRRGHWHDLTAAWESALPVAERHGDPAMRAYAHRRLALARIRLGHQTEAVDQLRRALDLYVGAADAVGEAHTRHALAYLAEQQGRIDEAIEHARLALDRYRNAGHRRGQGAALNQVGWYHARLGDHVAAVAYCEQALAVITVIGDRAGEAHIRDSLGYAYNQLGEHAEAVGCYQRALRLYRDVGDRHSEATTHTHLGDALAATGDAAAARTAWQDALAMLTDLGHSDAVAVRARLEPEQT
jgi:tetratricopeptide (TPR) repeat protein/DNA-binding XRE family transcriptional regulator